MSIKVFTEKMATKKDLELPIENRENLEINLNRSREYFYLHIFIKNNFLFSIQANRRIDLDDYLFINNLKITNDFVKKIYNK